MIDDDDCCPECEEHSDDCECGYTECSDPECGATFYPGDSGFGMSECFDCGAETYDM